MAVTAGGSHLCVWDMLSGGRLLARLSNHQKTVTCVAVSPMAGPVAAAAPRLLAGSLDGHVKVYELDTFKVRREWSTLGFPMWARGISKNISKPLKVLNELVRGTIRGVGLPPLI